MTDEEIQEYLADNGYADHIVRGGRQGLVARWGAFADELESGYSYGLEDYRNDLDIRAVIRLIEAEDEVVGADVRVRAQLEGTDQRVWESAGGDPWWDFGFPQNLGDRLLRDLRNEGLIEL